jgi:type VI protein secretion system component Hcp
MRTHSGAVIGALAAAVVATPALADGFMIIDGISVPAADTTDPGWMKVLGYAIDTTGPSSSGSGAGKSPTVQVTRYQDGVSPALFSATSTGTVFQQATLDVPASDGSQIVYKFVHVRITNDQVSSGPNGSPQETLTLAFSAMSELDKSSTFQANGAIVRIPVLTATLVRSNGLAPPPTGTPASQRPPLTATVHNPWAN